VAHHLAADRFGHEPYVDPVMHFSGGAACAFFFRRAAAAAHAQLGALSPLVLDLLAFGLACAAALAWELAELLSDFVLHTSIQTAAVNTLRDLALGVAGAIVYLVGARLMERSGRLGSDAARKAD
jgi:hypothetical protein